MRRPVFTLSLLLAACAADPTPTGGRGPGGKADDWGATDESSAREAAVGQHLEDVSDQPEALAAFLRDLPKGGDLHSHLSGAVATESLVRWGGQDGLCLRTNDLTAVAAPCPTGAVKLSTVDEGSDLWNQTVAAWSMEGQGDAPLLDRHQHFFDTFLKFTRVTFRRSSDMIAEVRRTAAAQNVAYLELMIALGSSTGGRVAEKYMKPSDPWDETTLDGRRAEILADPEIDQAIASTLTKLDEWEAGVREMLGCDGATPEPGCAVEVRYIVQTIRTQPRESVFGQVVYGFELAQRDDRIVGVNLVQAEEHPTSLAMYEDEMKAIGWLRTWNLSNEHEKPVHVSLHAGELAPELLPEEAQEHLTFHIRHAVEAAQADRIGHGVDLMFEDDFHELLATMAERQVMVEICLTSNERLVGATGPTHPLSDYLGANVPAALATDDEGVLRSSLTQEFVRAVQFQGLSYPTLKGLARASLEHSFLPGGNLREQADCAESLATEQLDEACTAFLAGSPRASAQWRLEVALDAFERGIAD